MHHLSISTDFEITHDTLWVFPIDTSQQKKNLILSPSVIREQDHYKMFYVKLKKGTASPNEVQFATLGSLKNLNQDKFKDLNLPLPNDYNPWHIDVFKTSRRYIMLLNGFYGGKNFENGGSATSEYSIQLLSSTNGKSWKNHGDLIGHGNPNAQKVCQDPYFRYVYRASGLYSEVRQELVVWYSYVTTDNVWKLAVHKFPLDFEEKRRVKKN